MGDDSDWPSVYGPAQDSYLLARAATDRIDPDDRVCEVGVGSGYVGAQVAAETGATVMSSDLNPHACRAACDRGLPVVRADLTQAFSTESFDVVLFNPPYLPTAPEDEWDDWFERALSGGPTGRRIVRPFLGDVGRVLSPDGRVLLLVSTVTGLDAVERLATGEGFTVEHVAEESYPFEALVVLELTADGDSATAVYNT